MFTRNHPQNKFTFFKSKNFSTNVAPALKEKKNLQTAWNMPLRVSYMKIKVKKSSDQNFVEFGNELR